MIERSLMHEMESQGHEQVLFARDAASGYRAIIAIHSRILGPALGGTRLWAYGSEAEALDDVLRLSQGMTYKAALAGVAVGGGKAVIIGDPSPAERPDLFRAHGRFVESLGGRYLTSVDIGTSPADMEYVRLETSHVFGLGDRSGDPSGSTARGVLRAIEAVREHQTGSASLDGVRVAIQGCGHVGASLAHQLHAAGARLVVCDTDPGRALDLAGRTAAEWVPPEAIYSADVDVFAPCARGAILNDATIAALRARAVAGGANNQLLHARHDEMLRTRGIVYAPDYAANAGGLIHLTRELDGASPEQATARVDAIRDTVRRVLELAEQNGTGTQAAADVMAEASLAGRTNASAAHWPVNADDRV